VESKVVPIVLFCFNRPEKVDQLLISLSENTEALASDLLIFIDGHRNETDENNIRKVISTVESYSSCFKSISITQREVNLGCAKNIVSGVSEVLSKYSSAIILEDDLEVSKSFLNYMNRAICEYRDDSRVWHIGGYSEVDIELDIEEVYFSRMMNCWAWATWSDRWQNFSKNEEEILEYFGSEEIKKFNMNGTYNLYRGLVENFEGISETWAVFWYASIFRHNGLCLYPAKSLVRNTGNDGSGNHVGLVRLNTNIYQGQIREILTPAKENAEALNQLQSFYKGRRPLLYQFALHLLMITPARFRLLIYKLYRWISGLKT
jgi:hypothetical protein